MVGCYLVETGLGGKEALKQLNVLWRQCARSHDWPEVPQTTAQADYIEAWVGHLRPKERAQKPEARRSRHRGLTLIALPI